MAEESFTDKEFNNAQRDATKASALQKQAFKPRTPSIASQAQNIFQGASRGMQAGLDASKFGDPTIAFLAGAAGVTGAPSAQEIENAVVQREIQAQQQALMQAPIADMPGFEGQIDQLSERYGIDFRATGLTVGQFQAYQPMMIATDRMLQQESLKAKQQPLEFEEAMDMAAGYTSNKEKQKSVAKGIVAGNQNGEGARKTLNSIFRVGVAEGQLGVSQRAQQLKEDLSNINEGNIAVFLAANREELSKNPLLAQELVKAAKEGNLRPDQLEFVNDVFGAKEEIRERGKEARLTEVERNKNRIAFQTTAHKFSERMIRIKQKFQKDEAKLTASERKLWEPMFGESLPEDMRSFNVKQLAQASRVSPAAAKSRSNAWDGMKMAESLIEDLKTASKSEVFLATMEKGFLGDGLRAVADSYFDSNTARIEFAKTEMQDIITRMRTGAALNNQEIEHYGKLILKWNASPSRNIMVVKTLHEFFRRVDEDIRRGRRIPGDTIDPNGREFSLNELALEDRLPKKAPLIILSPEDFDTFADRTGDGRQAETKSGGNSKRLAEIDAEIKKLEGGN